jgi:hypothetical protein
MKSAPERVLALLYAWLGVTIVEYKPLIGGDSRWKEAYADLPLVERQAAIETFERRLFCLFVCLFVCGLVTVVVVVVV